MRTSSLESFTGVIPYFTGNPDNVFGVGEIFPANDYQNTPISGQIVYDTNALAPVSSGCTGEPCFLNTSANLLITETILGTTLTFPLTEVGIGGPTGSQLVFFAGETANGKLWPSCAPWHSWRGRWRDRKLE